jgi:hypothetical protein
VKHEGALKGVNVNLDTFVRDHTAQLEKWYTLGWRDQVRPVPGTVEGAFKMELVLKDPVTGEPEGRAMFQGFVDVVSEDRPGGVRTIIDYKSGGRPVRQKLAEDNVQFVGYAIASRAPFAQIISFVRGERQKPTVQRTSPIPTTEERVRKFFRFVEYGIRGVRGALKTGAFPRCAPSAYYCCPSGCAFYGLCYPGKIDNRNIMVEKMLLVGECPEPEWHKKFKEIEAVKPEKAEEIKVFAEGAEVRQGFVDMEPKSYTFEISMTEEQTASLRKFFDGEPSTEKLVAVPFWAAALLDEAMERNEKEPE